MNSLKIALDWTPNTNHLGIFVAQQLGFYRDLGLEVTIQDPSQDNYALSPGKRVAEGQADFGIAPFETVISLNNKPNPVEAVAVYAILQKDISCIATLASSPIQQLQDLDGRIYASYKARYEDRIVQEMVKAAGGKGELLLEYPNRLGIWNTLLQGTADATWIFDNWEGVEAAAKGVELRKFFLGDYGIPYGYSPVIFTRKDALVAKKEEYSQFIQATQRGYLHAVANEKEALEILYPFLLPADQEQMDLGKSIAYTAPYFGDASTAGRMTQERVQAFLTWLVTHGLEDARILNQGLYSNELLG